MREQSFKNLILSRNHGKVRGWKKNIAANGAQSCKVEPKNTRRLFYSD